MTRSTLPRMPYVRHQTFSSMSRIDANFAPSGEIAWRLSARKRAMKRRICGMNAAQRERKSARGRRIAHSCSRIWKRTLRMGR